MRIGAGNLADGVDDVLYLSIAQILNAVVDLIEDDVAVGIVLLGLQNITGAVLQLEAELAGGQHSGIAGELLLGLQHNAAGGDVSVGDVCAVQGLHKALGHIFIHPVVDLVAVGIVLHQIGEAVLPFFGYGHSLGINGSLVLTGHQLDGDALGQGDALDVLPALLTGQLGALQPVLDGQDAVDSGVVVHTLVSRRNGLFNRVGDQLLVNLQRQIGEGSAPVVGAVQGNGLVLVSGSGAVVDRVHQGYGDGSGLISLIIGIQPLLYNGQLSLGGVEGILESENRIIGKSQTAQLLINRSDLQLTVLILDHYLNGVLGGGVGNIGVAAHRLFHREGVGLGFGEGHSIEGTGHIGVVGGGNGNILLLVYAIAGQLEGEDTVAFVLVAVHQGLGEGNGNLGGLCFVGVYEQGGGYSGTVLGVDRSLRDQRVALLLDRYSHIVHGVVVFVDIAFNNNLVDGVVEGLGVSAFQILQLINELVEGNGAVSSVLLGLQSGLGILHLQFEAEFAFCQFLVAFQMLGGLKGHLNRGNIGIGNGNGGNAILLHSSAVGDNEVLCRHVLLHGVGDGFVAVGIAAQVCPGILPLVVGIQLNGSALVGGNAVDGLLQLHSNAGRDDIGALPDLFDSQVGVCNAVDQLIGGNGIVLGNRRLSRDVVGRHIDLAYTVLDLFAVLVLVQSGPGMGPVVVLIQGPVGALDLVPLAVGSVVGFQIDSDAFGTQLANIATVVPVLDDLHGGLLGLVGVGDHNAGGGGIDVVYIHGIGYLVPLFNDLLDGIGIPNTGLFNLQVIEAPAPIGGSIHNNSIKGLIGIVVTPEFDRNAGGANVVAVIIVIPDLGTGDVDLLAIGLGIVENEAFGTGHLVGEVGIRIVLIVGVEHVINTVGILVDGNLYVVQGSILSVVVLGRGVGDHLTDAVEVGAGLAVGDGREGNGRAAVLHDLHHMLAVGVVQRGALLLAAIGGRFAEDDIAVGLVILVVMIGGSLLQIEAEDLIIGRLDIVHVLDGGQVGVGAADLALEVGTVRLALTIEVFADDGTVHVTHDMHIGIGCDDHTGHLAGGVDVGALGNIVEVPDHTAVTEVGNLTGADSGVAVVQIDVGLAGHIHLAGAGAVDVDNHCAVCAGNEAAQEQFVARDCVELISGKVDHTGLVNAVQGKGALVLIAEVDADAGLLHLGQRQVEAVDVAFHSADIDEGPGGGVFIDHHVEGTANGDAVNNIGAAGLNLGILVGQRKVVLAAQNQQVVVAAGEQVGGTGAGIQLLDVGYFHSQTVGTEVVLGIQLACQNVAVYVRTVALTVAAVPYLIESNKVEVAGNAKEGIGVVVVIVAAAGIGSAFEDGFAVDEFVQIGVDEELALAVVVFGNTLQTDLFVVADLDGDLRIGIVSLDRHDLKEVGHLDNAGTVAIAVDVENIAGGVIVVERIVDLYVGFLLLFGIQIVVLGNQQVEVAGQAGIHKHSGGIGAAVAGKLDRLGDGLQVLIQTGDPQILHGVAGQGDGALGHIVALLGKGGGQQLNVEILEGILGLYRHGGGTGLDIVAGFGSVLIFALVVLLNRGVVSKHDLTFFRAAEAVEIILRLADGIGDGLLVVGQGGAAVVAVLELLDLAFLTDNGKVVILVVEVAQHDLTGGYGVGDHKIVQGLMAAEGNGPLDHLAVADHNGLTGLFDACALVDQLDALQTVYNDFEGFGFGILNAVAVDIPRDRFAVRIFIIYRIGIGYIAVPISVFGYCNIG